MIDTIWEFRVEIIAAAFVVSKVTVGAYLWTAILENQTAYDRWSYWGMKLVGFLAALIVLPLGPWLLYRMATNWNIDPATAGLNPYMLIMVLAALIAAIVHIVGFPWSTYRLFRTQNT